MKTLAEAWESFRAGAIRGRLSPSRENQVKLAFFAGATFMFELVTGTGQAAPLPEDDAAAEVRLAGLDAEVKAFVESQMKRGFES